MTIQNRVNLQINLNENFRLGALWDRAEFVTYSPRQRQNDFSAVPDNAESKKYVTLPCKFVIQSTIEAVTIAFCRGMEWIDVIVLLPKVGFSF